MTELMTRRRLISVHRLHPCTTNPRRYHDPQAHKDLKNSLTELGQLTPIIVRASPNGGDALEIVCGERRWRAAKDLGWQEIEVIYNPRLNGDDELTYQIAAEDNLERGTLNPYEETVALLTILAHRLGKLENSPKGDDPVRAAADVLKRFVRGSAARRQGVAEELGSTTEVLDAIINQVCRQREGLRPESIVSNRLPLLNLPEDVHDALDSGRLPYTAARQIARVSDQKARTDLMNRAENLSVREVRDQVNRHLQKEEPRKLDAASQRTAEIHDLLREINERTRYLETLEFNATTAVLHALKRVRSRLP